MAAILLQDWGGVPSIVLWLLAIILIVLFIWLLLRWRTEQRGDAARQADREPVGRGIAAVTPVSGTTATPAIAPTPVVSHVPGVAAEPPQAAVDIPAAPDVPADIETVDSIAYAATPQAAQELLASEPVIPVQDDDLELIEGIGPKIAGILREAGIISFAQLAVTDPARLREICQAANLRLADPATWPEQARLAANGDLEGLQAFQHRLRAGRA